MTARPDADDPLERFAALIRSAPGDATMVALIVDSPWLPGYLGVNTLDFYFDPTTWLKAYERCRCELPGVALVPDVWPEFGMAAEPSGWGVPVQWTPAAPPGIHPYPGGLEALLQADVPDPETDGLMPVVLRQYERLAPELARRGRPPRIAAARGPLAVAAHLLGVTDLLMATQTDPASCERLVERTTALCIRWLAAQLERMEDPLGVLVLDDLVGMLGPDDAAVFGFPFLKRIFARFPGLLHLFHNDTPNTAVYPGLAEVGIDLFNLTHQVSLTEARRLLGPRIALMGNLAPLDLLVRGDSDQVRRATEQILQELSAAGPLIVSTGGGVSPGTPIANLQAMAEVVAG